MAKTSLCDVTFIDTYPAELNKATLSAEEDSLAGSWRTNVGYGDDLPYEAKTSMVSVIRMSSAT